MQLEARKENLRFLFYVTKSSDIASVHGIQHQKTRKIKQNWLPSRSFKQVGKQIHQTVDQTLVTYRTDQESHLQVHKLKSRRRRTKLRFRLDLRSQRESEVWTKPDI